MVQVWTARNSPPSGSRTARNRTARAPNAAWTVRATVEVRLRQRRGGVGVGRPVGHERRGLERRQGDPGDDLRERRVLGSVVLAQEHPEVAGAEALGVELPARR